MTPLNVPTNVANAYKRKKVSTYEQLKRFFPYKYLDYSKISDLSEFKSIENAVIIGTVLNITRNKKNNLWITTIKFQDCYFNRKITVNLIGQYEIYKMVSYSSKNTKFIVCGRLDYNENYHSFSIMNPNIISTDITGNIKIHPVYQKTKFVNEEYRTSLLDAAFSEKEYETIPEEIRTKYGFSEINKAISDIHNPKNFNKFSEAKKRLLVDDLLYFALEIKNENIESSENINLKIKKTSLTNEIIEKLPYQLTKDQKSTYESIKDDFINNNPVNALIQGDVGCGKSIISFLLMFLMAENKYQSCLIAPTLVLARQHYEELTELTKEYDIKVVLLDSTLKSKEKKAILEELESGKIDCLISTNSACSEKVVFKNLGLAIFDEEHKFGVEQRESLKKKSKNPIHYIQMSATPIPRTIADFVYGNSKKIYEIKTMPNGRLPIKTYYDNGSKVFGFIENELAKGRQCYVVCPLIEMAEEDSLMAECKSIQETSEEYQKYFRNSKYKIGVLTGKDKKADADRTIAAFKNNETQILISTTVIEVGINVPNASVMVIQNAERFGLAGLHQLRGRVGRGQYQSYCLLISDKTPMDNPRIKAMCQYSSGFDIAKMDYELRKSGDIFGLKQSGLNKYIEQVIQYPNFYKLSQNIAEELLKSDNGKKHIEKYRELNYIEQKETL